MNATVRIAGDDDVTALAALRRAWNEEDGAVEDAAFEDRFARWCAAERDTRVFFLLELDGVAVGMVNLKRYVRMPHAGRTDAGVWGYVGNLVVLAEHRNGGLGGQLMQHVIEWARAEGLGHLRLAPAPKAGVFYARLGFEPGAVVELDP